ncbi:glycosyltransferase [Aestuariicella sp. G3-2]|uniref:glycosyltransferase n=1 Tax=Pseudomaricurvus albidus TaxID=2842452 RepID=UPI001C0D54B2|nr:glycosyltransferase [Aestuariicella albida]MBU3071664.1 glycosyltransferase [Aestuariicella albida]
MTSLELTIPVLNEEASLRRNVLIVKDFFLEHCPELVAWSIVIADNGSTDRTGEIAESLAAEYPGQVKYLRVDRKGVGLALKHSWSHSDADVVGYMDLDLATDLKHLLTVFDVFQTNSADIIYGSRLHKDSQVIGRRPFREFTSRMFNLVLSIYLKCHFSDGMCGFKFLKRSHLKEILERGAVSDGWFFCTEILVVSEWMGLNLFELPVKWVDDPDSKVKVGRLTLEYLSAMKSLKQHEH